MRDMKGKEQPNNSAPPNSSAQHNSMQYHNSVQPALELSGVFFHYSPDSPLLKGIDLQILPGEKVGIIGPNGAGKTTLFLLISGILKKNAGEIRLFGEPVVPGKFYPEIGLVFQNPDDQLFCPTVRDDVAFGPTNLGLDREAVETRVRRAVTATGVGRLMEKAPHHLSGGEKRMVAIAGVLAMEPKVIIYDEPTSNLDIRYRRRVINFLGQSRETLLIASHDLEFILETCSRVVLLDNGRIIADGNPRVIMNRADLMEEHGLERPHSLLNHSHLEV